MNWHSWLLSEARGDYTKHASFVLGQNNQPEGQGNDKQFIIYKILKQKVTTLLSLHLVRSCYN